MRISFLFGSQEEPGGLQEEPGVARRPAGGARRSQEAKFGQFWAVSICFGVFVVGFRWPDGAGFV